MDPTGGLSSPRPLGLVAPKWKFLAPAATGYDHSLSLQTPVSYAASTGLRCGCGSFSRQRSLCGNVSMASHVPIYRDYAHQSRVFKDVLDYDLHPLDVSNWQECGRAIAASPSMDPLYGTVCRLLCATAAHHWTHAGGIWRVIFSKSHKHHPALFWRLAILAPLINVMTDLLYLLSTHTHTPTHTLVLVLHLFW